MILFLTMSMFRFAFFTSTLTGTLSSNTNANWTTSISNPKLPPGVYYLLGLDATFETLQGDPAKFQTKLQLASPGNFNQFFSDDKTIGKWSEMESAPLSVGEVAVIRPNSGKIEILSRKTVQVRYRNSRGKMDREVITNSTYDSTFSSPISIEVERIEPHAHGFAIHLTSKSWALSNSWTLFFIRNEFQRLYEKSTKL